MGAVQKRIIGRQPPFKTTTYYWCILRVTVRFCEGEKLAEQGTEEGKGHENNAKGLFGAVSDLSVGIRSVMDRSSGTDHAHLTTMTVFPAELLT